MDEVWIISNDESVPAALFFIEGELMNVIVKHPDIYETGETLTFLIDKKRIQAKLIKKQGYNLYLYISLSEVMLNSKRRKAVRSPINVRGTLTSSLHSWEVEVLDISMKGIAFTTKVKLQDGSYKIVFTIEDQSVTMSVNISNLTVMQNYNRYGCIIQQIDQQSQFAIRRYILMDQLQKLNVAIRK